MSGNTFFDIAVTGGVGSYFFEDLSQVRDRAVPTRDRYHTPAQHASFSRLRTPASAILVGLKVRYCDGTVATHWGDCVPVSFLGKSGRSNAWTLEEFTAWVQSELKAWLFSRDPTLWYDNDTDFAASFAHVPPYVRYGVSQALVRAAAGASRQPVWQIFRAGLAPQLSKCLLVPLHGSCGGDWEGAVDRMLARKIPYLPQGQFENLETQIGVEGKKLLTWVHEFKLRAAQFGYVPVLTLDFHGALDVVFGADLNRIAVFLQRLTLAALPHALHVESPLAAQCFEDYAVRMAKLRTLLASESVRPKLIADEWANDTRQTTELLKSNAVDGIHIKMPDMGSLSECAEAVRVVKAAGAFCLLGGSCTETIASAELSAHLAAVIQPDALLVKPGMGFDEAYALMSNSMQTNLSE